jgi:16S rRNA U1498 N3-methylase RsmE
MRLHLVFLAVAIVPSLHAEKVLRFKDGSEILVRQTAGKWTDCRGRGISEKGVLLETSDRCPEEIALALPATASHWVEASLAGMLLIAAGAQLLRCTWRKDI